MNKGGHSLKPVWQYTYRTANPSVLSLVGKEDALETYMDEMKGR